MSGSQWGASGCGVVIVDSIQVWQSPGDFNQVQTRRARLTTARSYKHTAFTPPSQVRLCQSDWQKLIKIFRLQSDQKLYLVFWRSFRSLIFIEKVWQVAPVWGERWDDVWSESGPGSTPTVSAGLPVRPLLPPPPWTLEVQPLLPLPPPGTVPAAPGGQSVLATLGLLSLPVTLPALLLPARDRLPPPVRLLRTHPEQEGSDVKQEGEEADPVN